MAGRNFGRLQNGIGNKISADHINQLRAASEADDARLDTVSTQLLGKANTATVADLSSRVSAIELNGGGGPGGTVTVIDGGAPDSTYGGE